MKKKSVYYFLGDSYSRNLLPFIKDTFKNRNFTQTLDPNVKWVVLSPTIDQRAKEFLSSLPSECKVALLLDWNFSGFNDYQELLETGRINLIFSPFRIPGYKTVSIPSPHAAMIRGRVELSSAINQKDLFFCSQPLREDRPNLGFDQFDLMRKVMEIARERNVLLYIKRHPRELSELPQDLKENSRLVVWSESLENALGRFTRWYGYNTIALYDARELGHQVTFLD